MAKLRGNPNKKFVADKSKPKRKPLSFRLPAQLKQDLALRTLSDGYGMRGKSKWVSEAILEFLKDPSWQSQVIDADMADGNDDQEVIQVDLEVKEALSQAVLNAEAYWRNEIKERIRMDREEDVNVSVAAIVRAAILWRYYDLRMPVLPEIQGNFELE